jgi:hypothetical protein
MRIIQEQLNLLALRRIKGIDWWLLAREAPRPDGLERLLAGEVIEDTPEAQDAARLIEEARGLLRLVGASPCLRLRVPEGCLRCQIPLASMARQSWFMNDVFTDGLNINAVAKKLGVTGAAAVYQVTLARQSWRDR